MNRIFASLVAFTLVVLATKPAAAQTLIDFNDGTQGAAIGGFYSALGVTFSNASWDGHVSANEGSVGAGGLKMVVIGTNPYQPKQHNPIVAHFAANVFAISIRGLNVGADGARIVAFDIFDAVLDRRDAVGQPDVQPAAASGAGARHHGAHGHRSVGTGCCPPAPWHEGRGRGLNCPDC